VIYEQHCSRNTQIKFDRPKITLPSLLISSQKDNICQGLGQSFAIIEVLMAIHTK